MKRFTKTCSIVLAGIALSSAVDAQIVDQRMTCYVDGAKTGWAYTAQEHDRKYFHDAFSVAYAAPRGKAAEYVARYYGTSVERGADIIALTKSYFEGEARRYEAIENGLAAGEDVLVTTKLTSDAIGAAYAAYNPFAAALATGGKVAGTKVFLEAMAVGLGTMHLFVKMELLHREVHLRRGGLDPAKDKQYNDLSLTAGRINSMMNAVGLADLPKDLAERFGAGLAFVTDPNFTSPARGVGAAMFNTIFGKASSCTLPPKESPADAAPAYQPPQPSIDGMPGAFAVDGQDPTAGIEPNYNVIGAWHRTGSCQGAPVRIAGTSAAEITSVSTAFTCGGGYQYAMKNTSPPIWTTGDRLVFKYRRVQSWPDGRRKVDTGSASIRFGLATVGGVFVGPDDGPGEEGYRIQKD